MLYHIKLFSIYNSLIINTALSCHSDTNHTPPHLWLRISPRKAHIRLSFASPRTHSWQFRPQKSAPDINVATKLQRNCQLFVFQKCFLGNFVTKAFFSHFLSTILAIVIRYTYHRFYRYQLNFTHVKPFNTFIHSC